MVTSSAEWFQSYDCSSPSSPSCAGPRILATSTTFPPHKYLQEDALDAFLSRYINSAHRVRATHGSHWFRNTTPFMTYARKHCMSGQSSTSCPKC